MTPAQLEVLNIIRANPYFCKNEYVLRERTNTIKRNIEKMLPKLETRLQALGTIDEQNELEAINIIRDEMNILLKDNYNAIIVKADINDKNLAFIKRENQAYLIYYFLTDSINPYMATLSVNPEGVISFYNPPAALMNEPESNGQEQPLNKEISKQLCEILKLPPVLLEQGPIPQYYKKAS